MDHESRRVGVVDRDRFRNLQALDDAIAYRRVRVTDPCADCARAPFGQRCDDHARDLELITEYQRAADAAVLAMPVSAEM